MKVYKVMERTPDRNKVESFLELTDALDYLTKRVAKGVEHLELYSQEVGCHYTLLYTYYKEN